MVNKPQTATWEEKFDNKFRFKKLEFDYHTCESWNDLGDENEGMCTLSDEAWSEIKNYIKKHFNLKSESVSKDAIKDRIKMWEEERGKAKVPGWWKVCDNNIDELNTLLSQNNK